MSRRRRTPTTGSSPCDLENEEMDYVERVVIHLPECLPDSKRTLYEAPFTIRGSGHAGIQLCVELHFKGLPEGDPAKKVCNINCDRTLTNMS